MAVEARRDRHRSTGINKEDGESPFLHLPFSPHISFHKSISLTFRSSSSPRGKAVAAAAAVGATGGLLLGVAVAVVVSLGVGVVGVGGEGGEGSTNRACSLPEAVRVKKLSWPVAPTVVINGIGNSRHRGEETKRKRGDEQAPADL